MQTTTSRPSVPGPPTDTPKRGIAVAAILMALAIVAAGIWTFGIRDSTNTPDPVAVTGSEVCTQTSALGGVLWYECQETTSDERVSGTAVVSVQLEHEPPTPMHGTFELTNEGGTWRGDWVGEITADSNHIMDAVLVGTGDYDGLQYRVRWEGVSEPLAISGTIEPIP